MTKRVERVFVGKGFQVGDRVRIKNKPNIFYSLIGVEGIISDIIGDEIWCERWSDRKEKGFVFKEDLEKIPN